MKFESKREAIEWTSADPEHRYWNNNLKGYERPNYES